MIPPRQRAPAPRRASSRWSRARLVAVVVAFAAVVATVLFLQRQVLFPSYMTTPDDRIAQRVEGLERWWIDTDQGRVEGWFMPGDGVGPQAPGPAVLFAHGNAELIEHWPLALAPWRAMGVSVLLVEYRGYGRSQGSPSQEGITADLIAFYDRLVARPEVDPDRIIFHGRSLGGGAVCALSRHRKARAMILQSTFTSVREMARQYFVPGFMVLDPFDNLEAVSSFEGPLLVVHGTRDALVPFDHGRRLAEAAPQGQLEAVDADHNDCPPSWEAFWERVGAFVAPSLKR